MEDLVDKDWVMNTMKGKDGIEEVLDMKIKPAIGENENYGSCLLRLILTVRTKTEPKTDVNVILKVRSLKTGSYSKAEEEYIFKTENKIYSEVLEAMGKLIKGNETEEILWPRCFGHKHLHLLMEDLTKECFDLYPKEKPLDEEHTQAVMRVYGKFHGLGLIVAHRALVRPQDLRTQLITGEVMVMPKFYTSGIEGLLKVMEQWEPEWKQLIPEVREDGENIWKKLKELAIKTEETGPCVLNHGDCWTNNILFKYDLNNKSTPQSIRLVDFQLGHFNSPAWDLTYFFYNALLPQDRAEKLPLYLETYTQSLAQTLASQSYKGPIPSTQDILRGVQSLSYYGFLNAITIRPLLIASKQEGFSLESEKLLDEYPDGPQCVHKMSFYSSPEVHDILKGELKQYLSFKKENQ